MRQHVTRKVIRDCHSTGYTQVLLRELYQAASSRVGVVKRYLLQVYSRHVLMALPYVL